MRKRIKKYAFSHENQNASVVENILRRFPSKPSRVVGTFVYSYLKLDLCHPRACEELYRLLPDSLEVFLRQILTLENICHYIKED